MKTTAPTEPERPHLHEDPITGEPGSHPVGTGVGAAVGGLTLGTIGAAAGPVGAAVGVTVGAILGGLTGKGFAEGYDPTAEEAYWREQHQHQPYAKEGYDVYARAYRTGFEGFRPGQTFEDREADLQLEYEGGPQKVHAEQEEAKARVEAEKAESMEDNLRSHPLRETAEAELTSTMEDNLRTRPLAWSEAREASRAAYERRRAAQAKDKLGELE